jgi:CAAX protease family protein
MKKYLKTIGNVALYAVIYFAANILCGMIIGIFLSIKLTIENHGSSNLDMQSAIQSVMNNNLYLITALAGIVSIFIFFILFKDKEQSIKERCKFKMISFKNIIFIILITLGISAFSSAFVYLTADKFESYQKVAKTISANTTSPIALICMIIIIPFVEEFLFRGMIFNEFKKAMPLILSIILQALIFALFHGNILQGIYTFLLGVLCALVYIWCKSIIAPIILHMTYNFMGSLVTPLLLSYSTNFVILYIVVGLLLMILFMYLLYKNSKSNHMQIS